MGEAHDLIRDIESLNRTLESKRGQLTYIQNNCRHVWGQTKYDPIVVKGYSVASREPKNYDDIAFAQGYTVPDKVTKRWTRTCTVCCKTEETTNVNVHTEVTETPKFR